MLIRVEIGMIKEEEMENRNLCPREMQIGQGQAKKKKNWSRFTINLYVCIFIMLNPHTHLHKYLSFPKTVVNYADLYANFYRLMEIYFAHHFILFVWQTALVELTNSLIDE